MTQEDGITALMPRIQRHAEWLRYTHYPTADADDLAQDAMVAILERASNDPGFLANKDAYVVRFAT